MLTAPAIFVAILIAVFLAGVRVLQEYERGVIFRFGRYSGVKQAGIRWIIPLVDRLVRISLREIVMDVPPQDVITRDNVSVRVNAVLYFRVVEPQRSIIEVEDGADTASARSYFTVLQQVEDLPLQPIISGRYHDTFHRIDGSWWFDTRIMRVDLVGDLGRHLLYELR